VARPLEGGLRRKLVFLLVTCIKMMGKRAWVAPGAGSRHIHKCTPHGAWAHGRVGKLQLGMLVHACILHPLPKSLLWRRVEALTLLRCHASGTISMQQPKTTQGAQFRRPRASHMPHISFISTPHGRWGACGDAAARPGRQWHMDKYGHRGRCPCQRPI
jgi:hypothetical protein